MEAETAVKTFDFFPRPKYAFLQGADAQEFLKEFNAKAYEKYGDAAKYVSVLSYDLFGQVITGSNSWSVPHVNSILRSQGIITASQARLEQFRESLKNFYEDSALVLRSAHDPDSDRNNYLCQDLTKQLPFRLKKNVGKVPIVIPLTDVNVAKDCNSSYGLRFQLRDGANVYEAPILAQEGNFQSEDLDKETGLPTKLGTGNRFCDTRLSGLSRLTLDGCLDVSSSDLHLAGSGDNGRIVVCSC